jgi:hypothetical protein
MLRTLVISVFALAFAAVAAQAESREVDNLFRLQVPSGWQDRRSPAPEMKLLITSPRFTETGGNCNVIAVDVPELQTADQATLNEAGEQVFTEDFWQEQVSKFQNSKIEKTGKRQQGARQVYSLRFSADFPTPNGATIRVDEQQDVHLVAGRMLMVTCGVRTAQAEREKDDIATVLTSFEPVVETPSVMLQPKERPSLTLYERSQFAGVSRVVTQDVSDLTQFGWSRSAASFSSSGAGAWQVCDGANFSGRCQTLSGSASSLPTFMAVSARHIVAPGGSFAAAGKAAQNAARAGVLATIGR